MGIFATVFIIAILVTGGYFVLQAIGGEDNPFLSVANIGDQCNVAGSGTTDNKFTCPSECDVIGFSTCTTQTGDTAIVVARAKNALYGENGHWIALANDFNQLEGYNYENSVSSYTLYQGQEVITLPYGFKGFISEVGVFRDNGLFVAKDPSASLSSNNKWWRYRLGSGANTNPNVLDNCQNTEICDGTTNAFICETPWNIKSGSGAILESGTISYSGKESGTYQTPIKRIGQNEVFNFAGSINWAVIDTSDSCAIDTCNTEKTGIIRCIEENSCSVKADEVEFCPTGEFCVDEFNGQVIPAICSAPFETEMSIEGGFNTGEPIEFTYTISSDRVNNALVTFKLFDTRNRDQVLAIAGPTSLTIPTTKTITFPAQSLVGTYEILVEKQYEGNKVSDEVYDFRIGSPLTLTMKIPYSELTGTNLLSGSPFFVDVQVSENGVPTTELASVLGTAKLQTSTGIKTIDLPNPIVVNDLYRFVFTIEEPGLFSFEANADKFGVLSNTEKREAEIREGKINVEFIDLGLITNAKPGVLTVKFQTKDPFDNFMEANLESVKIIPSGASTGVGDVLVTDQVNAVSKGIYQFDYNFESGAYIIEIRASAPGFPGVTIKKTPSINIDQTAPDVECSSSAQCQTGYICSSDKKCVKEDQPVLLYAILIFAGIFLIFVIIIIINLLRKRRSAPKEISIGGGL